MKDRFVIFCADGSILLFKDGVLKDYYSRGQVFKDDEDLFEVLISPDEGLASLASYCEAETVIFYNRDQVRMKELIFEGGYSELRDEAKLRSWIRSWLKNQEGR